MTDRKEGLLTIAIVRPYFISSKGGAERYAVELVRGLVALGHSVHVFAYAWDQPAEPGVIYHAVWMPRKPAWLRVLLFHWNLRRRLDALNYDAVLGMTPFFPQSVFWLGDGLYSVWTRVAWPAPVVRWMMCVKRAVMAVNLSMERKMLSPATPHFIANSKLVQRQAAENYGVDKKDITVVYPGIDRQRFHTGLRAQWRVAMRRQLGISNEEVMLLFVSNNFKRKGLDFLIQALSTLDESHFIRLVVVGAGRAAPFRRLAHRLGVEDKIVFTGLVDGVEKYYGASDVFVLPTRYDPCAAACLEAMACGLPVVTTRNNGASELIHDGAGGFVLSAPELVIQLKSRLKELSDPARCAAMGALAAARVESLTAASHVRQIAEVLDRVAKDSIARAAFRQVRASPEMVVNSEFLSVLEQHGLASFAALMMRPGALEIFYNRSKHIYRFALQDGLESKVFFLKRHCQRLSFSEKFVLRRNGMARSEGMREWGNILNFHQRRLPAVTPVAAGERILPDGTQESFVMTLGLEGFVPLDEYIAERFAPTVDPTALKAKRRLIEAVARLSRRMHSTGFNHRDYYLCHIFVRDSADGAFELRIIDLGRAGCRSFPRRRWLNKDLAQLHYSSLGLPLTDRDRLRFYAIYERREDTRRTRRRQLRRILKKSAIISRHDAKLRRSQLGSAVVAAVTNEESSGGRF